MSEKYCCNCGAKDGETAKENAVRKRLISISGEYPDVRFIVHQKQFDYLCQFCSNNPNYRRHYNETTGSTLTQV